MYLSNPVAYYDFLTSTVINLWDSASTTRALVGKSHYTKLSDQQRLSLIAAVDQTLIRYAFEGLESYGGQVFRVADVVVNEKRGMGWVQVLMESPIIPDINLDILIKRNDANAWQAVDIRVKGITYVAIKKHKYREILEEQGFNALMDNLTDKNTDFFKAVCAGANNPELEGSAPC
jgi:ABC-type transporter MlaC component